MSEFIPKDANEAYDDLCKVLSEAEECEECYNKTRGAYLAGMATILTLLGNGKAKNFRDLLLQVDRLSKIYEAEFEGSTSETEQ
jgi:hypothetical protein